MSADPEKLMAFQREHFEAFPLVVELTVRPGADGHWDVSMSLARDREPLGDERLDIVFTRVGELRLTQGTSPFAIDALQIRDISGRQWEQVNYFVIDIDEEVLRFHCEDFEWSRS